MATSWNFIGRVGVFVLVGELYRVLFWTFEEPLWVFLSLGLACGVATVAMFHAYAQLIKESGH